MSWSDLPPRRRATTRATIFFTIIIVISLISNLADPDTAAVLRIQDMMIAAIGAAVYAGVMYLVDTRLIRRKSRGDPKR